MRVSSFFAGIGGFDLGFERAGMRVVFQCEIDPFCQRILKRHWPNVPLHDDITTLNPATISASDLWCAGWPCQDLSHANTDRRGVVGERSGLFFAFMDLVREVSPMWLVMENVPDLLSAAQGTADDRYDPYYLSSRFWGCGYLRKSLGGRVLKAINRARAALIPSGDGQHVMTLVISCVPNVDIVVTRSPVTRHFQLTVRHPIAQDAKSSTGAIH